MPGPPRWNRSVSEQRGKVSADLRRICDRLDDAMSDRALIRIDHRTIWFVLVPIPQENLIGGVLTRHPPLSAARYPPKMPRSLMASEPCRGGRRRGRGFIRFSLGRAAHPAASAWINRAMVRAARLPGYHARGPRVGHPPTSQWNRGQASPPGAGSLGGSAKVNAVRVSLRTSARG